GPSWVVFGRSSRSVTRLSRPSSAPQHSCGYVCCPCARIPASTAAPIVSRRSIMDVPEALVEILLRAVREDGDDDAAREPAGDVEHRRDRGAGGDPGEQ